MDIEILSKKSNLKKEAITPPSMDKVRRRIINCTSEGELKSLFYEIYLDAINSRDLYNGSLRKININPYDPLTPQWGHDKETDFDQFMKEVTSITRDKFFKLQQRKAA